MATTNLNAVGTELLAALCRYVLSNGSCACAAHYAAHVLAAVTGQHERIHKHRQVPGENTTRAALIELDDVISRLDVRKDV